jgi:hypothetical protein
MGGASSMNGRDEKCLQCFGKLERKRPLSRSKRRWEDNITTDLREIGWESVDWVHLAHDNEPSGYIKGGEFLN